jgi:uncharacterized repeat protein (TIGR01451 family)
MGYLAAVRARSTGRGALLAMAIAGFVMACAAPSASADRAFTPRFAANVPGDIAMAANGLLSCADGAAGCAEARAGTRGAKLGNNSWDMRYIDVDTDPSTFDSSRADLALPADASVLFAGLYWGANTNAPSGGSAAADASARNTVRLATPAGGGYVTVTANQVDQGSARSQEGAYQSFADVTALVRAAGAGTYTTANVQTARGIDRYAGWSLVVAYTSPSAPPRNLTVFDGFETVNSGDAPREFSVSGFRTPRSGPVRSKLGFVAYEGDLSLGGDKAYLNSRKLQDSGPASADNFFNSTISNQGANVTSKDPNYVNQLGFDADIADATGYLPNGATSGAIKLETTGDTYLPGVIFIATDLFAPDVQSTKSVTDVNGGQVEPGDVLEYVISGVNRGQDDAVDVVVIDPIPAGTDFVPGSLQVGGSGQTDASGDDLAEFDSGGGQVAFRVGSGATAVAGGRLVPNEGYEVRYRVQVGSVPSGTQIVNQAHVKMLADQLGFPIDKTTNDTRLTTTAPDLAMGKGFAGTVTPGQTATYTLTVSNVGDAPTRGEVVVEDPMPATISFGPPAGPGWACTQTPAFEVRCTRSDPLAPGASYPPITIAGTILSVPPLGLINTSIVSGGGDVNKSNNAATAAPPFTPQSPLSLDKQVTPDTVAPGEEVTYLLTVRNSGGFGPVDPVQLSDPLPAGLTALSVEALDGGSCDPAVSCNLGSLDSGAVKRVRIRARVGAQAPPGDITNTAPVNGPNPDPDPSDNTATQTVHVRQTALLSMTKRLDGTPRAGQPVRWIVTVSNAGPHTSPTGANVVDDLSGVVEGPSASVPGGSCTVGGQTVGCSLPPIASGASTEITVSGTLSSGSRAAQLLNGAQIEPAAFVPLSVPGAPGRPPVPVAPAGSSTPPGETIRPAADVGVAKVATPDPAARGGVVTYRLRATNHGPSAATGVTVSDRLPAGMRYLSAKPTKLCSAKGRTVTCRLGELGNNRSREIALRVRLGNRVRAASIANNVTIDAQEADPATANNRDRAVASLAPRLVLRKTAGRSRARVRDTISYTLRLSNRGPSTARNVVLCDRPRAGLVLRRAPGSRKRGEARCWNIGTLASGRTVSRRVVASIGQGKAANRTNVATVSTGGTRAAAARAKVRVLATPVGACPSAAWRFGLSGPLANPAC